MTGRAIMAALSEAFEEMVRERYLAEASSPTVYDWRIVFEKLANRAHPYEPAKKDRPS